MKKTLATLLALCLSALCLATVVPGRADAGACGATISKTARKTIQFDKNAGDLRPVSKGWNSQAYVDFKATVYYRDCGASVYVNSITLYVDPDYTGCLGGYVQNYQVNGNYIGKWNAGNKTFKCQQGIGSYGLTFVNAASNKYVFPSDPANRRCFGAGVKVALHLTWDESGSTNSVCIV